MRVIVSGPRDWKDQMRVWNVLSQEIQRDDTLVLGGARGVDQFALDYAHKLGISRIVEKADWERYGDLAGPVRNGEMITKCEGQRLIAFVPAAGQTPGTADMIKQALARHLPVTIYGETGGGFTWAKAPKPLKTKGKKNDRSNKNRRRVS